MQKKTAIASFIVFSTLFFVPKAFAETKVNISNNGEDSTSNVNIHTNTGNNTICVNGKCTTSNGNEDNQSTVCINGKCTTTSGNVDMQSDNGNAKVHIDNDSNTSSPHTSISPIHPSITMPTMPPLPSIATPSVDKVLGDMTQKQKTQMEKFFAMIEEKLSELKKLFHF